VATDGQRLYCGTAEGDLVAFHLATGQLAWKYRASGPFHAPPLIVDRTLYEGSIDGYLYALDAATGALRWRFYTGGEVTAGCTADAHHLYFASWSGEIGAIRR
jgi:outer membrane protein assembly factor BamB